MQIFYSHTGRPSVDPELIIRMLMIGYCFYIRSERRLIAILVAVLSLVPIELRRPIVNEVFETHDVRLPVQFGTI